jgi:CO/xanthine dehydrogenase Mo-binding subunit
MVLADSPHTAEDGADAVKVDYERQEPVVSLDTALAEDVRTVHEGMEDNVLLDVRMPGLDGLDALLDVNAYKELLNG